jgi:hypothetical protein
MIKRIYRHFSKPKNLALLNGVLIAILIAFNIYFQAFCIPTTWTIITLVVCFTNTILYPFLDKTKFAPLTSFINGITLFVFIYCIIFLENMNLLGLIMIIVGLGLLIFIPHFFIIQMIWKNLIKPSIKTSRYFFLTAIILCIGTIIYIGQDYKKAINSIDKFKSSSYKELDKNFMTEKILGMHFIYHTQYCFYDGWRPPKHEPILVIGMWLNNRIDPLNMDIETRLELYKKFFPNKKYKFDCSCGIEYRQDYHNDEIWAKKNPAANKQ